MQPIGALLCQLKKVQTPAEFDTAGVIVLKQGIPHVAEQTFSGVKVRVLGCNVSLMDRFCRLCVSPKKCSCDLQACVSGFLEINFTE